MKSQDIDAQMMCVDSLYYWAVNSVQLSERLKNKESAYYMKYGAGRRFNMLFYAYRSITNIAHAERKNPLSQEECVVISQDINTIYTNLIGVLDNLAWCLLLENNLTEENLDKTNIGLFSKEFRILPLFKSVEAVKEYDDWYKEIRNRRDPVAHRIPLYVIPTVTRPDELDRYNRLYTEHLDLLAKSEVEAGENILNQMEKIGEFHAIFTHHPKKDPIPIYPTVPTDMENLIKISNVVEKALLNI